VSVSPLPEAPDSKDSTRYFPFNVQPGAAMQDHLYDFYNQLRDNGIIFCFSGPVSQHVIEGIGQTLRQKMELAETGVNTMQKVFSIFVEQMQNIVNYSADKVAVEDRPEGDLRVGILVIGQQGEQFYVLCGNKVVDAHVGRIRDKIEGVRSLDKDQLKSLYRERRKLVTDDEVTKGAGLGFIDMARKASRPLEYSFVPAEPGFTFFSIKVII
jgi:hypothetical protein